MVFYKHLTPNGVKTEVRIMNFSHPSFEINQLQYFLVAALAAR